MESFRKSENGKIAFSIPPESPCPCGSMKQVAHCCMTNSELHKHPMSTSPPSPKTGNPINGCYAAILADCGGKLSREHYISKNLLNYLNKSKGLTVSGLPWLNGKVMNLSPDTLASQMLCERHNSALSPLDEISLRFFRAFDERESVSSNQSLLYLFSGHDFERWLLKVLCGLAFSGNLNLEKAVDIAIPELWLDILFGQKEFPDGMGLYVCKEEGHPFRGPWGLGCRAISNSEKLTGLGFYICGYEFILSMSGFPTRRFDEREFVYRPFEFYTTGQGFEKSVIFCWEGATDKGTIHFRIDKTYPG